MTRISAHAPWGTPTVVITPAAESLPGGVCQTSGGPGGDEFFSRDGETAVAWQARQQQVVQHCWQCPIMLDCRRGAIERGERIGVWGGLTESELGKVSKLHREQLAGVQAA